MLDSTPRLSAATLARRIGLDPRGASVGRATIDTRGPSAASASAVASSAAGIPAYRQLADRIRGAVLDGRLAVNTGLPSERDLAQGISMSRTTVAAAYSLLRDDGWLDSRRGSGSRLRLPGSPKPTPVMGPAGLFGHVEGSASEDVIDLTTASLPAPAEALTAAVNAAAQSIGDYLTEDGYRPFGLPVLRQAVAQRYSAAGLPTSIDQILITNGAQHGFSLVVGELSSPGDRIMIECPTYPVALDAIRAQRRIPGPVGLLAPPAAGEASGKVPAGMWDLDLFAATLRQTAPRLAYLIPDFQNPTGALMDAAEREQLVTAARRAGTVLVIDESFRDVPFPGSDPLPPSVAAFADDSRVITLGSVSKSIWGGLRIGWIRTSPALVNRLAAARALGDMAGPILDQLVVAHLLDDAEPAFRLQGSRLAAGANALLEALATDLPEWRPLRPRGGASLWVRLPSPYASELAGLAPAAGVRIAPGPRFGPDGTMESYLRLPYTAPVEQLRAAAGRLAAAVSQVPIGSALRSRSSLPGWLT